MAHEERWEHRMERIWEKRFSSIRNTDGDTSQDSADSARSTEQDAAGARDRGQGGLGGRVRPRSASGVLLSGAGEVDEMHRQLRVIGDMARDLDTRIIHPHHTGIADEDAWLKKANYERARVRRGAGSRSAACQLM